MKHKDFWSTSVRYYNRKGKTGKEGIFLITGSTGLPLYKEKVIDIVLY